MTEMKNQYFETYIHAGNIIEIKYLINKLNFMNIVEIDRIIRNEIKYYSKILKNKIILVLNLINIKSIDSSAIGATIQAYNDLKETKIYCINLNEYILKTYKRIGLDHTILLLDFDSIDEIIKNEVKND